MKNKSLNADENFDSEIIKTIKWYRNKYDTK